MELSKIIQTAETVYGCKVSISRKQPIPECKQAICFICSLTHEIIEPNGIKREVKTFHKGIQEDVATALRMDHSSITAGKKKYADLLKFNKSTMERFYLLVYLLNHERFSEI